MLENPQILIFASKFKFFFDQNLDFVLGMEQRKGRTGRTCDGLVEEKFGEQNFRVLSEMRILAKIRVVILDFGRVSRFFSEIWREFRF